MEANFTISVHIKKKLYLSYVFDSLVYIFEQVYTKLYS